MLEKIVRKSSHLFLLLPSLLTILGCLTGISFLQSLQIHQQQSKFKLTEYQQQENKEKLQLNLFKKVPALGFENILADWLYLQFIQYFGDGNAREQTGYGLSPEYFEQVVDRDSLFIDAVLKLDTATAIFDGYPQKSVALLSKSLASIPPDFQSPSIPPYYLWAAKGIDELLFLGNPQAAKRSYQMAVNWAKRDPSSKALNFVRNAEQTIQFLNKNPKSRAAQIGAWASVLGTSPDPRTVKRVIREIIKLGGEVKLDADGRLTVRVPPYIE